MYCCGVGLRLHVLRESGRTDILRSEGAVWRIDEIGVWYMEVLLCLHALEQLHVREVLLFLRILFHLGASVLKPVLDRVSAVPHEAETFTYIYLLERHAQVHGKVLLGRGAGLVALPEVGLEDIVLLLRQARLNVGRALRLWDNSDGRVCRLLLRLTLVDAVMLMLLLLPFVVGEPVKVGPVVLAHGHHHWPRDDDRGQVRGRVYGQPWGEVCWAEASARERGQDQIARGALRISTDGRGAIWGAKRGQKCVKRATGN